MNEKTQLKTVWALSALTLIVLVVAVFALGVYKLGWDNGITNAFLKIVPLPAAIVDGDVITIAQLNERVEGYMSAVEFQTTFDFGTPTGIEFLQQQKKQILDALIEAKIVSNLAKENQVELGRDEIEEYYDFLLEEFRISPENAEQQVTAVFGWSLADFRTNLVEPDLLRAQLQIRLIGDKNQSEAYQRIVAAKEKLDQGVQFETVAESDSDDKGSSSIGGELGLFTRDQLPPWFGSDLFALAEGEISDILVSPDGYHIFQVVFRDDTPDLEQMQIRHILVDHDVLSEVLAERKGQARVYVTR